MNLVFEIFLSKSNGGLQVLAETRIATESHEAGRSLWLSETNRRMSKDTRLCNRKALWSGRCWISNTFISWCARDYT